MLVTCLFMVRREENGIVGVYIREIGRRREKMCNKALLGVCICSCVRVKCKTMTMTQIPIFDLWCELECSVYIAIDSFVTMIFINVISNMSNNLVCMLYVCECVVLFRALWPTIAGCAIACTYRVVDNQTTKGRNLFHGINAEANSEVEYWISTQISFYHVSCEFCIVAVIDVLSIQFMNRIEGQWQCDGMTINYCNATHRITNAKTDETRRNNTRTLLVNIIINIMLTSIRSYMSTTTKALQLNTRMPRTTWHCIDWMEFTYCYHADAAHRTSKQQIKRCIQIGKAQGNSTSRRLGPFPVARTFFPRCVKMFETACMKLIQRDGCCLIQIVWGWGLNEKTQMSVTLKLALLHQDSHIIPSNII